MTETKAQTLKAIIIVLIFTFQTLAAVYGQPSKTSCECPKTKFAGTKADTTFDLSNGKKIVLCGYKNPDSKPTTFSEFILAVCGQDTIIDFWGAALTCRLEVRRDTLVVDHLEKLPIGENFNYQETVWIREKIFFGGQKLVRKLGVNRQIGKYNQNQILSILKSYETAKFGLDDDKMRIANQLFIAAISGNIKARQHFKEFKTKFGKLDGAYVEEYNSLTAMLGVWDAQK